MNLVLDIGNTFCKICVFDCNKLIYKDLAKSSSSEILLKTFEIFKVQDIKSVIISSVNSKVSVEEELKKKCSNVLVFNSLTPIPVKNLYSTPKTLGLDRLAASVGAFDLFEKKNCLIIDAGTAITYDFLNSCGEFLGGNIAPGIRLRFSSLNEHTSKLPLIEDFSWGGEFGNDTFSAVSNGVLNGLLFEIEGYTKRFGDKYPDGKIILTGGDTIFLSKKLKNTIFAEPNLVAIGLNRILNYNVF